MDTQILSKMALPSLTLITSLLLLVQTNAAPIQASLTSVTDLTLETHQSQFRLRRFPSPFFKGYFGKGWCSDIDIHLEIRSESTVLLKSCRISNPVRFDLGFSQEAATRDLPNLRLKKVGTAFILKRQGIAIAQFNLQGQPTSIRSSHDGKSPSSEWFQFRYQSGRLSELGFWKEDPHRSMAAITPDRAAVTLDLNTNTILEIQTRSEGVRYQYQGQRLTKIQKLPIERSPD